MGHPVPVPGVVELRSVLTQQSEEWSPAFRAAHRELAIRVLKSRLLEIELEKREDEMRKLRGEHVTAGWGNQIRSYVLHPYQMVKDHRTKYEVGDPSRVLDGDVDPFIKTYLLQKASGTLGVPEAVADE